MKQLEQGRGRPRPAPPVTSSPPVAPAAGACLLGLSFSTALFALAASRLVRFTVDPALVFPLLLPGFAAGALVGARLSPDGLSFRRALHILLGAAIVSAAACLLLRNFDPASRLVDAGWTRLFGRTAGVAALFLPGSCAAGLCLTAGWAWGAERIRGGSRSAFALA